MGQVDEPPGEAAATEEDATEDVLAVLSGPLPWIVSGVLMLLALGGVYQWSHQRMVYRALTSWPVAEATVTTSHTRVLYGGRFASSGSCMKVRMEVEVGGRTYRTDPTIVGTDNCAYAVEALPVGSRVRVHYDPRRPRRTVIDLGRVWLENDTRAWSVLCFLAAVACIVGARWGRVALTARRGPDYD